MVDIGRANRQFERMFPRIAQYESLRASGTAAELADFERQHAYSVNHDGEGDQPISVIIYRPDIRVIVVERV